MSVLPQPIEPGLYLDLPNEDYHKGDGVSATRLKQIIKKPELFFSPKEEEEKKAHFEIGKAFEMMLLEPHKYEESVVVFDPSKRPIPTMTFASKENKAWKEEFYAKHDEKIILDTKQQEAVLLMFNKCMENPDIAPFITGEGIMIQPSMYWRDKSGLLCKTRQDIVKERDANSVVIVDVKTMEDASPKAFVKQLEKLHYGVQAGGQVIGAEEVLKKEVTYYLYLCVEKKPPYSAELYGFNGQDLELFKTAWRRLCRRAKRAIEDLEYRNLSYGRFTGSPTGIMEIQLTPWYKKELEENLEYEC